jgi:hypothetical protein
MLSKEGLGNQFKRKDQNAMLDILKKIGTSAEGSSSKALAYNEQNGTTWVKSGQTSLSSKGFEHWL